MKVFLHLNILLRGKPVAIPIPIPIPVPITTVCVVFFSLKDITEFLSDISIDVPLVAQYMGDMIGTLIAEDCLSIHALHELKFKEQVDHGIFGEMVDHTLSKVHREVGTAEPELRYNAHTHNTHTQHTHTTHTHTHTHTHIICIRHTHTYGDDCDFVDKCCHHRHQSECVAHSCPFSFRLCDVNVSRVRLLLFLCKIIIKTNILFRWHFIIVFIHNMFSRNEHNYDDVPIIAQSVVCASINYMR